MGDSNDAFMRNRDAAVQARTKAQNRATVLQLKLIGQSHPTGLTTNLLKLFEPRPPLEYKPPPEKRKCPAYAGIAQFVSNFAEPEDPEYSPPVKEGETPTQKRARIHQLRLEKGALQAAEELQKYDPNNDPNTTGDPYKTLFVARLNYETTEHRIKREFEIYGPIKRVRLVTDTKTNKPRGYAFIEYMHTRDMKNAYKQADGRKLDNRRVLVDVERGRTVPNWRPRRLGGGLGSTRVGGEEVNQKYSGRESQQAASGSASRTEEPRAREDRHHVERDPEKSRERGRERDRDRDREKSRDRDARDDRHHRERDRNRDKERERERGRDRDRAREKERDRDHDRERDRDRGRDRERDRHREKERDYDYDRDHRGHSNRDKEDDFDGGRQSRDRVEPDSDKAYDRGYYDHSVDQEHGYGGYGHDQQRRNDNYEHPEDSYQHDLNNPEQYDHRMGHEGSDYRARGERSRSRGYDDE